VKCRQ